MNRFQKQLIEDLTDEKEREFLENLESNPAPNAALQRDTIFSDFYIHKANERMHKERMQSDNRSARVMGWLTGALVFVGVAQVAMSLIFTLLG